MNQKEFFEQFKQAEAYLKQGQHEKAKKVYADLLQELNQMPSSAELESRKKLIQQIIKHIETKQNGSSNQILQNHINSSSPSEIYEKALSFKELGLYKEAIEEFKKALAKRYKIIDSILNIIECFEKQGLKIKAIQFLENLLKTRRYRKEDIDQIKYELGRLYEEVGAYAKAISCFQGIESKQIFPDLEKRIKSLYIKIKGGTRFDYLLQEGLITREDLQKAVAESKKENKSVEYVLIERYGIPKNEVGKSLSLFYGVPFIAFDPSIPIPVDLISNLKYKYLKSNYWVPIKRKGDKIVILIDDPHDLTRTDIIKNLLQTTKLEFVVGIREDIENFIDYFWGQAETEGESIRELVEGFEEFEETPEEIQTKDEEVKETDSKVVLFVNKMILDAWRKRASDIHIEPSSNTKMTSIRFRIDGICQPYINIPNSFTKAVVSRIKIMANLDIAEKRLPQDGKIKFKQKGKVLLELRVATLPTVGGHEDVVLRLLHTGTPLKLSELGMSEENLKRFQKIITEPYGLVLVVGPTGSGKTTTLHSALSYINTPDKKIWTAEDPVEITQEGLRQVEVHPKIGLTFARVMRAFLRADPDVIMIGEMRDEETANTGIEASLTGHLVFSTLHTNSAPETVTRLLEMGLDPHNFADSLLGILAQRLVRKLCSKCKESYHPSKEEFNEIVEEYGAEHFGRLGITYSPNLTLYRARGCEVCGNTGYKGRIGIHELLINDEDIKVLIKKKAPTEEIRKRAILNGMTTLKQDGIAKVFKGITDIKEVRRVCIK